MAKPRRSARTSRPNPTPEWSGVCKTQPKKTTSVRTHKKTHHQAPGGDGKSASCVATCFAVPAVQAAKPTLPRDRRKRWLQPDTLGRNVHLLPFPVAQAGAPVVPTKQTKPVKQVFAHLLSAQTSQHSWLLRIDQHNTFIRRWWCVCVRMIERGRSRKDEANNLREDGVALSQLSIISNYNNIHESLKDSV